MSLCGSGRSSAGSISRKRNPAAPSPGAGGSHPKVVANEAEAKHTLVRDASLPPAFVDASEERSHVRAWRFLVYLVTSRLHGSTEPALVNAIATQIALTECEDETGTAKTVQLMLPQDELAQIVGAQAAQQLLDMHGARPVLQDERLLL